MNTLAGCTNIDVLAGPYARAGSNWAGADTIWLATDPSLFHQGRLRFEWAYVRAQIHNLS